MKIIKVTDMRTRKKFLDTARIIYKNDPVWVCPLDKENEAIFDPSINPYFTHGEVERWILEDDNNKLTGRIAAFIDKNLAWTYGQPTGGIGFFECIDDKESAFLLFNTTREWLKERKMEGFHLDVSKPLSDRFTKIAEWVMNKPGYEFQHFSWKKQEQQVKDFAAVFNEAWASFKANFEPLEPEYIKHV